MDLRGRNAVPIDGYEGGMMEINDYLIVTGNDLDDLTEAVQARIAVGWIPTGGVAISRFHHPSDCQCCDAYDSEIFAQAMVKS